MAIKIHFTITPQAIQKFTRQLKKIGVRKVKDYLTNSTFKDKIKNAMVSLVVEHIDKEKGPSGKWPAHSLTTVRTRAVKKGLGSVGGYRWYNVLAPRPRAFLSPGVRADMINRTKIKVSGTKAMGLDYEVSFHSDRLSQDVSYGRSGIMISELKVAHDPIQMGGLITPRHKQALVLPITQAKARKAADNYLTYYQRQHPRTIKTAISPQGRGNNLSYRQAGIVKIGGQTALLRSQDFNVSKKTVGGKRPFVYVTPKETSRVIRDIQSSLRVSR